MNVLLFRRPFSSSGGNHPWLPPPMDICSGHFDVVNTTAVLLPLLVALPAPGPGHQRHPGSKSREANRTAPWTSLPLEPGSYSYRMPQAREELSLFYPFLSNLSLDVGLFSLSNSSSLLLPPAVAIEEEEDQHHIHVEAPNISSYNMRNVIAAQPPRKLLGDHGEKKRQLGALNGKSRGKLRPARPRRPVVPDHGTQCMLTTTASSSAALLLLALLCTTVIIAGCLLLRCKRNTNKPRVEVVPDAGIRRVAELCASAPRWFCHRELAVATRGFADEMAIGRGGFGPVYRGYLGGQDRQVAIKVLAPREGSSSSSAQGIKEFESEVKVLSRLRHRNIVQLLGWCEDGTSRDLLLLVYEFMSNGSLHKHLYDPHRVLPWPDRYNIALGVGSAVQYLHTECVVNGDIKPANIMLDSSFQPKLGDFGLARLLDHGADPATTQVVAGTIGYIDPELVNSRRPSAASDVYSFGVVLLEIACGRRLTTNPAVGASVHLLNWVGDMYRQTGSVLGAADRRLDGEFDERQMERVLVTGLWCVRRSNKPWMSCDAKVQSCLSWVLMMTQLFVVPWNWFRREALMISRERTPLVRSRRHLLKQSITPPRTPHLSASSTRINKMR